MLNASQFGGMSFCVAVALILVTRPRAAFAAWIVAVIAVPYWLYLPLPVVGAMPVVEVVGLLVVVGLRRGGAKLTRPPPVVFAFFTAAVVGGLVGSQPLSYFRTLAFSWLVPVVLAGLAVQRIGRAGIERVLRLSVLVVSGLAVVEFVAGFHPFQELSGPVAAVNFWSEVQHRGGLVRSEGVFGHGIALGGFIALLAPFAFISSSRVRLSLVPAVLVIGGVLSTLSRGPILSLGILLLAVLVQRGDRRVRRAPQIAVLVVVGLLVAPYFVGVFGSASAETAASSTIRTQLVDTLRNEVKIVGTTDAARLDPSAERTRYGSFSSVDNAYLYLGLQAGLVAGVLLLALFGGALRQTFILRRARPEELGLAVMVPLLWTVALLTQWQCLIFLFVGMCLDRRTRPGRSRATLAREQPRAVQS